MGTFLPMGQSPEEITACDCIVKAVCKGNTQRQVQVELVMSKFSSDVFVLLDFTSFAFFGGRVCVCGCMCWKQCLDDRTCDVRRSALCREAGDVLGLLWERGDDRKHQAPSLAQHRC